MYCFYYLVLILTCSSGEFLNIFTIPEYQIDVVSDIFEKFLSPFTTVQINNSGKVL